MYTILKCTAPECPGHGGDSPIIGTCAGHQFDLGEANLIGADLREASLYGANLDRADLRGASLIGASLGEASLIGANLRGASLYGANLRGADLYGANLSEARGIVVAGPCDGRMMYGVCGAGGMMVQAGCLWATPAWLREHWKAMPERAEYALLRLACLEALEVQARALGWVT